MSYYKESETEFGTVNLCKTDLVSDITAAKEIADKAHIEATKNLTPFEEEVVAFSKEHSPSETDAKYKTSHEFNEYADAITLGITENLYESTMESYKDLMKIHTMGCLVEKLKKEQAPALIVS